MDIWLILEHVFTAIIGAMSKPDLAAAMAKMPRSEASPYSVQGNVAVHQVTGVLSKVQDFFAMLFGGGNLTYGEISRNLLAADADPSVSEHKLFIDSPGGTVAGLFECLDTIRGLTKPISTVVTGTCASAAYAIASQTSKIEVLNASCVVGSIGVMTQIRSEEGLVTLTSSGAPNKAPDVSTDEGRKAVIARLDETEEIFVAAVAEGRKVSKEKVLSDFGRGGVFLAKKALQSGMIDGILSVSFINKQSKSKEKSMDLNELKTQHPAVYTAAIAEGVTQERNRVSAHVILGEASGAVQLALKNVKEGKACDDLCQAEYLAAKMNATTLQARAQESTEAGGAATGGATPPVKDMGDKVAELLEGGIF